MKIVTNGSGLYAIRKGVWPFYRYFDLETPGYWWFKSSRYYIKCFSQKDKVEAWFGLLNPKVVKTILDKNDRQK